jgi:hypothetical protein
VAVAGDGHPGDSGSAREYSERLWKRVVVSTDDGEDAGAWKKEGLVAVGPAVLAAVAITLPELFGESLESPESWVLPSKRALAGSIHTNPSMRLR